MICKDFMNLAPDKKKGVLLNAKSLLKFNGIAKH
jgi:hypothetical protein